ncbi:hypothetical protein ACFLTD_01160, partial [Elusimicrobiota bacterium]
IRTDKLFDNYILHYYERMLMIYFPKNKMRNFLSRNFHVSNREVLDIAYNKNKGIILLGMHMGAQEMVLPWLGLNGYSVTGLARIKTQKLRNDVRKKINKTKDSGDIDFIEAGFLSLWTLRDRLRKNNVIFMACDEAKIEDVNRPVKIKLLDKYYYFEMRGLLTFLECAGNSEILFGTILRSGKFKYNINFENVNIENTHDYIEGLKQRISELIEENLLKYPEQWFQWQYWNKIKA